MFPHDDGEFGINCSDQTLVVTEHVCKLENESKTDFANGQVGSGPKILSWFCFCCELQNCACVGVCVPVEFFGGDSQYSY